MGWPSERRKRSSRTTSASVVHSIGQAGAFCPGAGGGIAVELLAAGLVQGVFLQLDRLLPGRDEVVADLPTPIVTVLVDESRY